MSKYGKLGGVASDHSHIDREKLQHPHGREKKTGTGGPEIHYPFWFGGSASCFAATVTHPLDLGKLIALRHPTVEKFANRDM